MPSLDLPFFSNHFVPRVLHKALFAVVMALCLLLSLAASRGDGAPASSAAGEAHEWPTQWEGRALRPLALSAVEQRFAQQFPGHLARMTDGRELLVLRAVRQPTRMLHPASDCYRALGYRIAQERLERDAQQRLWRCFTASHSHSGGQRVCERIEGADGSAFTDTSAWYWAALAKPSAGPWQAVTRAQPL